MAKYEVATGKSIREMINFRHYPYPQVIFNLVFFNLSFVNTSFLTVLKQARH